MKKIISLTVISVVMSLSSPVLAGSNCYVIGDTSGNQASKPPGSKQNPYGSLALVEADASCQLINVEYSTIALDGGIALKNGQTLIGRKGPGGELPAITNTTLTNTGAGILLAKDNTVKHLHIKDTQHSAIRGINRLQPFSGSVTLHSIKVSGANQQGFYNPANPDMGEASIFLVGFSDTDYNIKQVDVGDSNVPSIVIYQIFGDADVKLHQVDVHDQGQLSSNYEFSPGIYVGTFRSGNANIEVLDSSVSNIGSTNFSNSDGLLLLNSGSGDMTGTIDNFQFYNAQVRGIGSTAGIEVGIAHGAGGGSYNGSVTNSTIDGPFALGIQIVDQFNGGSNLVEVEVRNNTVTNTRFAIEAGIVGSPNSSTYLDISNNVVSTTPRFGNYSEGIYIGACCDPLDNFEVHIEGNSILNVEGAGMVFNVGGPINNVQLDAGLGGLGSAGENRIIGTVGSDIVSIGSNVSAANNWWGNTTGPSVVVEANGGTVDFEPFLTSDPLQ